jgi:hypothetical protein
VLAGGQTATADSITNCDFSGLSPGVITITNYGFRPDKLRAGMPAAEWEHSTNPWTEKACWCEALFCSVIL